MTEESVRWRKWCRAIIVDGMRVDNAKEKSNRYVELLKSRDFD